MNILITGTSGGIGSAIAEKFLSEGHHVTGFDKRNPIVSHEHFNHITGDICDSSTWPSMDPQIVIDCAGVQNSSDDIEINLKKTIEFTENYINPNLIAVTIVGSASAITGSEFPMYAASKAGLTAYVKNLAMRLAPKAICNGIHPGGVLTDLNRPVMDDPKLWKQIMDLTPLKRWATAEEIADWVYFVSVTNRFMTGQNILIDGGEATDMHFIWPEN